MFLHRLPQRTAICVWSQSEELHSVDQNSEGQRCPRKDCSGWSLLLSSGPAYIYPVSSRCIRSEGQRGWLLPPGFIFSDFIPDFALKLYWSHFFTTCLIDALPGQVPLVATADLKRELETLQYREHKRLAIQGQIVAARYLKRPKSAEPRGTDEQQVIDIISKRLYRYNCNKWINK